MRKMRGFILLDILFAVFIIQIIILVLNYYVVGVAAANFSAVKTQAAYTVHNKMEEIRAGLVTASGSEVKVSGRHTYRISWDERPLDSSADGVLFKIYVRVDYHTLKGSESFESVTYHVSGLPTAPQW